MTHPDFKVLGDSWQLHLRADGYAKKTRATYQLGFAHFMKWLSATDPDIGPNDVTRQHIRAWLAETRDATSSGTARTHYSGMRSFYRWALAEQEVDQDPMDRIRIPEPNDPKTELLTKGEIRALIDSCATRTFVGRRDAAILWVFADGGLRLSELADLKASNVDVQNRIVVVLGKGSNRSGPRRRGVPLGVKATRALDRYLRERRRHPYADSDALWLGDRGRPKLSTSGVVRMLERRARRVGIKFHPHMFRHTWASAFRREGGSEGDLMTLGGWTSRAMLDRYGYADAEDRAREAYRRLSFGDRL